MNSKIILDVNIVTNKFADDFPFLNKHIANGNIRLVFGTKKYRAEVGKCAPLRRLITQLSSAGKLIVVDEDRVDTECTAIDNHFEQSTTCKRFCDDPHLFALSRISGVSTAVSHDHNMVACYNCHKDNCMGADCIPRIRVVDNDTQIRADYSAKRLSS